MPDSGLASVLVAPDQFPMTSLRCLLLFGLVVATTVRAGQLRIGAAAADITPEFGVLLDGTISKNGPATKIHDRLHARCVVFDDGETRVALVIIDNTMIAREILDDARARVHAATDIPARHILLAATHTHSTPRAVDIGQGEANEKYHRFMAKQIAVGVQVAVRNLRPAGLGWGSYDEPRFVFNRRWFVDKKLTPPNPFGDKGDRVWMNPPRGALINPAGPVDTEVYVMAARRPDGTPVFLLGNYGLHYVGGTRRGEISADYFGIFSEHVKQLLATPKQQPAFVGLMSNGTSGDVNAINFQGERVRRPAYVRMREIGTAIATNAAALYRRLKFQRTAKIEVAWREISLGVRKPNAKRLAWARETIAKAKPTKRPPRNVIYANEAIGLSRYPDRVKIILQAIRIGDLAIAAIPNEVFAQTGLMIKAQSPFRDTFVIELANGYSGYLPYPKQHEWGGYETWPARSSFLEVQAEPKIKSTVLELLSELK